MAVLGGYPVPFRGGLKSEGCEGQLGGYPYFDIYSYMKVAGNPSWAEKWLFNTFMACLPHASRHSGSRGQAGLGPRGHKSHLDEWEAKSFNLPLKQTANPAKGRFLFG